MDINELSRCEKCGIWWMPRGGDPDCPLCEAKAQLEKCNPEATDELLENMKELQDEANTWKEKLEHVTKEAKKWKGKFEKLNDSIDAAQGQAKPKKAKKKATKTVDDVMEKKLEKHTKKALKE